MKLMMGNYNVDDICIRHIKELSAVFDIKYVSGRNRIILPCPVHGGDNPNGCTLFLDSPPNWKCWTKHCESSGKSISNFFRLLLQKKTGEKISFSNFCLWIEGMFGETRTISRSNPFIKMSEVFNQSKTNIFGTPRANILRLCGEIPQEMVNRGYSPEILKQYDIFNCMVPGKSMYQRTIVPIYDVSHRFMIGCTGRSIFEQCRLCSRYHEYGKCPSTSIEKYNSTKWKHSKGLKTSEFFYNIWTAKEYIEKTGTAILVESCGNVWKLAQNGIYNSLGMFGCDLGDGQMSILESLPIRKLVLLLDNDEAGHIGQNKIILSLSRLYNIVVPDINYGDCGDISELSDSYVSSFSKLF